MSRRPRVLIVPEFVSDTAAAAGRFPRYELRHAYVAAIEAAGGLPFVAGYVAGESRHELLDGCDALLLSGGAADLDPARYGQTGGGHINGPSRERAAFEIPLLLAALDRGLPVLGVCGGMQTLNVALGGTLHQHLPVDFGTQLDHQQHTDRRLTHHEVTIVPGSRFAGWLRDGGCDVTAFDVNSTHHQGVARLGAGLSVCAVAPDGLVEAIELTAARFVLGVQWHPELIDGAPQRALYRAFAAAAAER